MPRGLIQVVTIAAALLAPLAAFGGATEGEVVVAPAATSSAPAVGTPLLALLAVGLFIAAAVVLRRRSPALASGLTAAVAVVMLVTAGYAAFFAVVISGPDCEEQTAHNYPPDAGAQPTLRNDCDNPMVVVEITIRCEEEESPAQEVPPQCEIGTVLQNAGDECRLPVCDN